MNKKLFLSQVAKINTSEIIQKDLYIDIHYTKYKASNNIISIGDNQIFKFLRMIKGVDFDNLKKEIEDMYRNIKRVKGEKNTKENSKTINSIRTNIEKKAFVPDIIMVKCDSAKKDYKNVCKNGFRAKIAVHSDVYDIKYKRLCAGAGQLRRNTAIFVNEIYYDDLEKIMMCGLDKKRIGKINLAKFSAYYALYSSSTHEVTTPRICVIPDFKYDLENQKINWIFKNEDDEMDIELRDMSVEVNAFDGSGIITPRFAKIWCDDLGIDYLASSFIIRSAWIKGLVSVFDLEKFSKEVSGQDYIIDIYGNKQHVKDIDIILTASQFKMWKKYTSFEEYLGYFYKYNHSFGVSRVNKKDSNIYTSMNYQYVQSNSFTSDSIKSLVDYSVNWINKIMSGDYLYSYLLMIGSHEDDDIDLIEKSIDLNISKAIMYNKDLLNDGYVRMKIIQIIQKKINQLKIGKALVNGSYEFAIPDLYALCEHAFKLDVVGLLKSKESWSKRWVDEKAEKVAVMRSPLVSPAENQVLNIYNDDLCEDWFKYINNGLIINIWDTTMMACSDADYDGDILLSTNDKNVLDSIDSSNFPITYEKNIQKEQYINPSYFADMDTKSFDSKIGFITNLASTFISMMSNFNKDSEEYKELRKRVDLLRYFQGSAIDATKGDVFIPPPKKWNRKQKYHKYDESNADSIKEKNKTISFENKICGDKKPYFFGYVYSDLLKNSKSHKKKYLDFCKKYYGMELLELSKKKNKTKEEADFISQYYKEMPLMHNKSIMNELTYYVEKIEFKNKWIEKPIGFDYKILKCDKEYIFKSENRIKVIDILKKYNNEFQKLTKSFKNNIISEEEYKSGLDYIGENSVDECYSVISNEKQLVDLIIDIMYNDLSGKSATFMWNYFGEVIVENLKLSAEKITIAIEDLNGDEYLGKKYILKDVVL